MVVITLKSLEILEWNIEIYLIAKKKNYFLRRSFFTEIEILSEIYLTGWCA